MFKSLYKETEGFRLVSILTPLCMIGEVVMEMIIPKLMSSIIDDGVTAGNLSHIYRIGGWMIVAAAFGLLFGVLGGVFGARASTGYARNLRRSMYRNIQTFSFANIDKYSTAGLVTRMTTDVTNIQNAYQMILRMAIRAPSSMVIAMIMAFTINAKLASIYLVAVRKMFPPSAWSKRMCAKITRVKSSKRHPAMCRICCCVLKKFFPSTLR